MSLPKIHRLKRRQDFNAVYQTGLRRSSLHLTLRALRLTRSGHPIRPDLLSCVPALPTQIGISIGLKVSKRAVIRNRIKRQIKAAFRQLLPRLAPGWWLVIGVKPNATECAYAQFLQELEQLLEKAEVLVDGY